MTRRGLLTLLASLPLCGWMKPKTCFGFVDLRKAQEIGIYPSEVYDADGNLLERCASFNDETGEVTCYLKDSSGRLALSPDKTRVESVTFIAKLPLKIVRL